MKKRLLSIALILVMVLAILPIASLKVFATDTVESVAIRIAPPEVGNGPTYTLTPNNTNLGIDYIQATGSDFNQDSSTTYQGVTWYDGIQPMSIMDGEYQIGHSYSVSIIVAAPTGKEFKTQGATTPDVTATVNGETAIVAKVDGYQPHAYLKITYTFNASHAHISKGRETVEEPTCTKQGKWEERCAICNTTIEWDFIPALGHSYKATSIQKATLNKNGVIYENCVECNDSERITTIFHPSKFTLSKTSFTYNNKVQKPTITIKDSEGYKINSSNYTVTYSNKNSKKVGEYKVTIKFKGDYYQGTKTFTYQIVPKGTSISKLKAAKKKFTASWKKQATETTGYQIQYSTNKNFKSGNKTVNITKNKTTSKAISKLKAKKKYFVRIRTYKKVGSKKIYSSWSSAKNVKTK